MVSVMLDKNLLIDLEIKGNSAGESSHANKRIGNIGHSVNYEVLNIIKTDENECNLVNAGQDPTTMNTKLASNLIIKAEPETKDFKFENVPHGIANDHISEDTKDNILDHSYCSGVFSLPYKYKDIPYNKTKQLLGVGNDEYIDASEYDPTFENCSIKKEELDLKKEDLKLNKTRTSSDCVRKNKLLHISEKHDPSDDQTALDDNLHSEHSTQEMSDLGKVSKCKVNKSNKNVRKSRVPQHNKKTKMYKCNNCEFKTPYRRNINHHLLLHRNPEEVKKFKCNQCEYQSLHKGALNVHLLRHINSNKMNKLGCKYQTIKEKDFKMHSLLPMKPGVKLFECNNCSYQTFVKRDLSVHIRRHKKPEELTVHRCNHCAYETFDKSHINRHLLQHMNPEEVKKFKCTECKYRTLQKCHLKKHMKRHNV